MVSQAGLLFNIHVTTSWLTTLGSFLVITCMPTDKYWCSRAGDGRFCLPMVWPSRWNHSKIKLVKDNEYSPTAGRDHKSIQEWFSVSATLTDYMFYESKMLRMPNRLIFSNDLSFMPRLWTEVTAPWIWPLRRWRTTIQYTCNNQLVNLKHTTISFLSYLSTSKLVVESLSRRRVIGNNGKKAITIITPQLRRIEQSGIWPVLSNIKTII